jgi:hypothetical protein
LTNSKSVWFDFDALGSKNLWLKYYRPLNVFILNLKVQSPRWALKTVIFESEMSHGGCLKSAIKNHVSIERPCGPQWQVMWPGPSCAASRFNIPVILYSYSRSKKKMLFTEKQTMLSYFNVGLLIAV